VPLTATRCKYCSSPLLVPRKSWKRHLTLFFFLTTIFFAILAFTWYDSLEREKNKSVHQQERIEELENSLADCYEDGRDLSDGSVAESGVD
jgi:hypothetical protein